MPAGRPFSDPFTALAGAAMLASGWRRALLAFAFGALGGLSVAPLFVLPALFVAFPVLVWCLDGAERSTGFRRFFGAAFAIGFWFGLGYFLVAIHWVGAAFFVPGGAMLALMPFAVLALAATLALFWAFGVALAHLVWTGGPSRLLALAAGLTLAELARSVLFSGFPFDLLGYALTANDAMAQAASLVGVYGLTFFAPLLGATPALIWPAAGRGLPARLAPFFLSLLVLAGQLGYGQWRLSDTVLAEIPDLRLRLVQPMLPDHVGQGPEVAAQMVDKLLALSQTRLGPDDLGLPGATHLIWPESALQFHLSDYPEALARIARTLPANTMLLAGAPRAETDPSGRGATYNAILAIDASGEVVASYDKTHLVPVGEYLPFPDFFRSLGITQFVPGIEGWTPGVAPRRLFSAPDIPPFLPLICYEAIFPLEMGAVAREAQFILNVTNDGWFAGSIGPAQHFHHARMRAIEQGLSLVRVGNTGVTALVDPLGRIVSSLAENETGLIDVVPLAPLEAPLYARTGILPLLILLALLVVGLGFARRAQRSAHPFGHPSGQTSSKAK